MGGHFVTGPSDDLVCDPAKCGENGGEALPCAVWVVVRWCAVPDRGRSGTQGCKGGCCCAAGRLGPRASNHGRASRAWFLSRTIRGGRGGRGGAAELEVRWWWRVMVGRWWCGGKWLLTNPRQAPGDGIRVTAKYEEAGLGWFGMVWDAMGDGRRSV